MQITSITAQVKTPDRYSISVDGEYAFSLSGAGLLEHRLAVGDSLTQEDVVRYKKLSADDKAYGLALAYVARRMRSRGELLDYFRRKQYDAALSEALLSRLERAGFIDDREFALRWAENRRQLRSSSATRIRMELKQKRVDESIIQEVLQGESTSDAEVLAALIVKKRQQTRYRDDEKLIAYLARQGFRYDAIKAALSEIEH